MKPKEILSNTPLTDEDVHGVFSYETPLRPDAFEKDDDLKIELIEKHFREIMHVLGMDLSDDSLKGTPHRVAKMYVKEVFSGLNPSSKPTSKLFDNKYNYDQMLVEKDITFYSHCEHHFVPIYGKAHVAYFSSGKVIGLSKINRIVQYFSKRPQVQERLTVQIAEELKKLLNTEDIAVVMDAKHMCVSSRGVGDTNSQTGTAHFSGKFNDQAVRSEFLNYVNSSASK
ncbi:MAG: GTP cyclohydrolase I FolE [Cyclobacteriaceae bacterium]|jgi:GTP cyclohydrolase I|nr:GTP cyclohydrolase I FolE [Cyclobacteriaceae bacterium]MDC1370086.1 GTP cyclohydrolase I FolE [Cyclobacteriaceae bacterium]|tara:strand:+ start:995 stop:1675 length:681 start_codon:yes stop_codon:yes gene_type:complete